MNTFKVGDKVCSEWDLSMTGEVINLTEEGLDVKWDNDQSISYRKDPDSVIMNDPVVFAERAKQAQVKVDQAAEYIKEAFKAWEEATDLYHGNIYAMSKDKALNIGVFESACEHNMSGWSSSSLYC